MQDIPFTADPSSGIMQQDQHPGHIIPFRTPATFERGARVQQLNRDYILHSQPSSIPMRHPSPSSRTIRWLHREVEAFQHPHWQQNGHSKARRVQARP
ncbi:hypothetical protein Nepgr_002589 [Nepenthes gracilis]|uniref:Uncharacterized protein n=1 Tax=Nepenthes gracilis TaxID=150966 RepID=A0AAD3P410_NEPGR|nr:hypothetical protein Nepgr_002589 [Nepenthes gracilis]